MKISKRQIYRENLTFGFDIVCTVALRGETEESEDQLVATATAINNIGKIH